MQLGGKNTKKLKYKQDLGHEIFPFLFFLISPNVYFFTNSISPVLLSRGRGDGVAVVAAEENDRALERGREVEPGVGVALAGCALAEITNHGARGVGALDGVGCTHGFGGKIRDFG